MLATLSHTPVPLTYPSSARDTMATSSLPIIPPRRTAPSQRPKLIINTEQPRIPGKAASLRLDLLSALSPTVRNTFSNAYDQPAAPSRPRLAIDPAAPSRPRLAIDSSVGLARSTPTAAAPSTPDSAASTLSSAVTSASSQHSSTSLPYKQPHHLTSILANSPARAMLPRKMASTRPRFPAEKRVSFRTPLEEAITTVKYTLAHSDLQSSCSTLSSISSASEASSDAGGPSSTTPTALDTLPSNGLQIAVAASQSPITAPTPTTAASLPPRAPRTGEKRDSSSSEDDSDSCPETPVAGRRKRTRDWRWTLGPLAGKGQPGDDDITTSEDST